MTTTKKTTKKSAKKPAMKIVMLPVTALIPFANNARTHSDGQVAEIAASIREFGFTNPILLDGRKGIIAGHGRLQAARKLELTEVPCIELAHLTENQKRAYILADNRLAEHAGWDEHLLNLELSDLLQVEDLNIELTGFTKEEIDALLDMGDGEFPDLNSADRDPFQQKTFNLHDDQAQIVEDALMKARASCEIDTGLNENSNGNAIAYICEQWLNAELAGETENDHVAEK